MRPALLPSAALLLALPLSACFDDPGLDEALTTESGVEALSGDLVEEPRPFIDFDGRTAVEPGYPLHVYHSWHGTCETFWDPCEQESYEVEVSCSIACELSEFESFSDGNGDGFYVTPLELGELTIRVTMRGPYVSGGGETVKVLEATSLEIDCVRGRLYPAANRRSCNNDTFLAPWDGVNINEEIHLLPVVRSGGIKLQGLTEPIARTWRGYEGTLAPPKTLPATIEHTARYRDLEASIIKVVLPNTSDLEASAP